MISHKSFAPALGLAMLMALSGAATAQETFKPATPEQQYSYAQGFGIGVRLKGSLIKDKADLKAFAEGFRDALSGKAQMSQEQMISTLRKGPVHLRAAREKKKMDNAKFLAENRKKPGVTETASGLQYSVIKAGSGDSPKATDTVVVHYTGKLTNGTVFDSSVKRGKPATFPVNRVVPGWSEVLQLMKPGAKWSVVIPPKLGYGERGAGGVIGPNEILLFDIELLEVKKK
ncbi:MAG TPA: FKBP-type peptidyl-prolyl cis-trans isomerase [Rhizobiales bacterium]|nr:FKBP-type peptidyl-prolyl cis-trans isomerase [Hyphomicrobiales bacterium]